MFAPYFTHQVFGTTTTRHSLSLRFLLLTLPPVHFSLHLSVSVGWSAYVMRADHERIAGFRKPRVRVFYAADTLHSLVTFAHDGVRAGVARPGAPGAVERTKVVSLMQDSVPQGVKVYVRSNAVNSVCAACV